MATMLELVEADELHKLDPQLSPRVQEDRVFYASGRLKDYLIDVLPTLGSTWNIEESPVEQFDAFIEVYASGKTLTYGHDLKPLNHIKDGIWQLKTADLRIFGWFPICDHFVGVVANTTDQIKLHNLYYGHAGEVGQFRDALDLDEPKFIAGRKPENVVSNFSYP